MSSAETGGAPAGVRPVPGSAAGPSGRLRWVEPGSFTLAPGDRVAVREGEREWLGEVVVPPARLVEWTDVEGLPVVVRRVPAAEWPSAPTTDGRRLLESLGLPSGLLARARPGSASGTGPG